MKSDRTVLTLRLPEKVHQVLREKAHAEKVSINRYLENLILGRTPHETQNGLKLIRRTVVTTEEYAEESNQMELL